MEKIVEQALLYDFYGELLTPHQKEIYEDVVLNDYSLSEVAKELGISRQGVFDMIRRCNKILNGYEEKLHLVQKFVKTKERIKEINALSQCMNIEPKKEYIEKIQNLSHMILEEF